ncbi:MAG TPA: RNA polymerase sigma factor [Bdellovibrionales bacterium]|nr:RNA polymerase sigma factor [Bdellovibrionales bacterium]
MLTQNQTDEELMALYQDGSEEAFKALYSRHSGKILGYLESRVRSHEKAMDLFQEVFVKIHRSKHLYNRLLPVLPWIFSVTHSVLVDGKRRTDRKKEVFNFDFDQLSAAEITESKLASVAPMLAQLPANQSAALELRYLDEKTFEEIADTLKTSPLNVRQIISRGVKNLKRLVSEGEKP